MQKMYANIDFDNNNQIIVGIKPIIFGDIEYTGCKKIKLVNYDIKDENGNTITMQKIDDNSPVEYDNLTQLFMDADNSKNANAQLLAQYAKSQINNATLVSQNAKQQLINAQLLTEIAKLKGSTK